MKIAVSATEPNMDAAVDQRFGRCSYFVVFNTDTEAFEAISNSSAQSRGGAGISAAQLVAGKDIGTVITGNCGPNAYQVLEAAKIKLFTGASGKIRDAIQKYQNGEYSEAASANVSDHFGSGGNRGSNMGHGKGRT